jgi:sulfate/thiosulfate transport system permease protein
VIVLLPLAAVVEKSTEGRFWETVSSRQSISALELTIVAALLVAAVNAVFGTLVAWVLVRDTFPGKRIVNALIDLPFALPTIVAGLTLMALWGQHIAYTRTAIVLALLFVTLPFVVRAVQPVLVELDTEMEEAAASLGARGHVVFRRIVLPNLLPAILSGMALAFARAVGEYGSVVMLSGNVPFSTEVASVHIYSQIQSDYVTGATAMSIVLLAISLAVLLSISALHRRSSNHDR